MGVSIGKAIDYLVSGTNTAGMTLLAALLAVDATAVLADNMPDAGSQSMVFIGRTSPDDAATGAISRQFIVLGATRSSEDYIIPCFISVTRPGPAQKPARDAALALFDTIAHWVQADLTLGGVLTNGRSANIADLQLTQTRDDEDTSGGAQQVAWVMFGIHCTNLYTP
jgi:hypothetical protein